MTTNGDCARMEGNIIKNETRDQTSDKSKKRSRIAMNNDAKHNWDNTRWSLKIKRNDEKSGAATGYDQFVVHYM